MVVVVCPVFRFGVCLVTVEFILSRPITRRFRLLCTQVPLGSGGKTPGLGFKRACNIGVVDFPCLKGTWPRNGQSAFRCQHGGHDLNVILIGFVPLEVPTYREYG